MLTQRSWYLYWREHGLSRDDAIRAAVRDFRREREAELVGLTDEQVDEHIEDAEIERLANFVLGKRGSSRRVARRSRS
jgi:Arc/MetJ-type ribon-helix-helix transcriptional regulator